MTVPAAALALLPGALTVYLAFNSGGYFPGATAVAALVLAAALLLQSALARDPIEGLNRWVAVAAVALMLYAAWTLLSASWSDSSARALLEFDRGLLYLFALLLFGLSAGGAGRLRILLWGLALAAVAISVVGLLTRTLPDVFPVAPALQEERLGYPIGYWNALGLVAAFGIILCLHLTSSEREPRAVRVTAAAALPAVAVTLYFTFSRGPIAAAVIGLVAYMLVGRPRVLITGLLAGGLPTAFALVSSYNAELLGSKDPTTPDAVTQGHELIGVIAFLTLVAAVARFLLLPIDTRLARLRFSKRVRRSAAAAAALAALVAGVLVLTATALEDTVSEQADRAKRDNVLQTQDVRERLNNPGINRQQQWQVAIDGFEAAPVKGHGAGTFPLLWERDRPVPSESLEAHSLYLESLGELGVIGLVLVALALGAILLGLVVRMRGRERPLYAAIFALTLMWALHAVVDWDWELPVVTLWLFAAGGAALASPPGPFVVRLPPALRGGLVAGCVVLGLTPALVAVSQTRLVESVEAYEQGRCDDAAAAARSSISALGNRPEPYEILAYCNTRSGRYRQSMAMMGEAIERDPENWEYRYGLALVRAAAGRNPRRPLGQARKLNPRASILNLAEKRFRTRDPRRWRRAARDPRLSIP